MQVRAALASDVPALAELARRTFVATFVEELGVPYPAADLESFLQRSYGVEGTAALLADPALRVWVAEEEEGVLVGYVLAGPCGLPHPEASAAHGELKRLYVAHEAHGRGAGRALMQVAFAWLASTFTGPTWLGVWSGNFKAQQIYQRLGFEKVGEYDYPVGSWNDREHIYRRP